MQDNIESDFLQRISDRLGRVEDRVILKSFFITAEDGFLIDDFQVTCLQIGCKVAVEKRIVVSAVWLQAGLPYGGMDQIVADGHQGYLFCGNNIFFDHIGRVFSLKCCPGIVRRSGNRQFFLILPVLG